MTKKRFEWTSSWIQDRSISAGTYFFDNSQDIEGLCNLLNELHEENQQLKSQLQNTSDQRDEFHHGARENANRVGQLEKENKELKEEVQLLKEGIEAYENAIPYVCTCGQVNDIHSEMFDFWMKQNKFYMEHPSRCTVIIDGVRYK